MKRRWRHIGALRNIDEFRKQLELSGVQLPCDDEILVGHESPLGESISTVSINGKMIGNRWAIHPMEGWDGTPDGGVTDAVRRRWRRFGESGAKLICGGEAMAVRRDGRANPHQLVIADDTRHELAELIEIVRTAHLQTAGTTEDLVIGFQLTHSGRFSRPQVGGQPAQRVAFRHPLLDERFHVTSDAQVLTDAEVEELIACFVRAASIAREAGADFVDIKHCHGYLWHEFLGAHTRTGLYGGCFENRTRALREIVAGIRASGNPIDLAVRLSIFDTVPYEASSNDATSGRLGVGRPADLSRCIPYVYGFGIDATDPTNIDLAEPIRFVALCERLGVKILNASSGSPYYCPHIQRPAAYPPSDGYEVADDPLVDVARLVNATRRLREAASQKLLFVGTGYSYLQDFLPHVAQAVVRHGWVDLIGIGRMALSYPEMPHDALSGQSLARRRICRTFSDCTTAPRNGLPSGCYPLDGHYADTAEAEQLRRLKSSSGAGARRQSP